MNWVLIAVVLYEILCIGSIGLYLSRAEKKGKDSFLLSNRDLPIPIVGVTLALTVLGSAHVFGLMELAWDIGAVSIFFSIAHVVLICVICLTTGRWVRRLNVATVPELIEKLYGSKIRIAVACVMAGSIFGLLTMEAQTIGIAFSALTGWTIQKGVIVGSILGILYVVLAGMKEIGWVNLVNTIVMYIGLILAAIFLTKGLIGGWEAVETYYTSQDQGWMLNIFGTPDLLFTFGLSTILTVVFAQGISQMALQTAMSAKNENTVRKALLIAAPVNGLFGIFTVLVGLAAKSIPKFNALGPKMAGPTMLVKLLPPWLVAILLASFLGALLSTFAMNAMTPSTLFVKDIFVKLKNPNSSEKQQTNLARAIIILLGLIAMAAANALPPIVNGVNWLFAWLVPVFWIVIYGLFWKRSATVAGITLVVSWIVNLLWSFTSLPQILNMANIQNGYVTFFIAIVLGGGLNLFVRGEDAFFKSTRKSVKNVNVKLD